MFLPWWLQTILKQKENGEKDEYNNVDMPNIGYACGCQLSYRFRNFGAFGWHESNRPIYLSAIHFETKERMK